MLLQCVYYNATSICTLTIDIEHLKRIIEVDQVTGDVWTKCNKLIVQANYENIIYILNLSI